MLMLQDDAGNRGYVVLRHLNGDDAEIVLPGGSAQISFSSLEPFWFGDYRLLWQLPDYVVSRMASDDATGEELWIGVRMMELADTHGESPADSARIKRLSAKDQVRWYQSFRGLTVDGISGAMTVIQINNDLKADVPRLVSTKPGGKG
jgi:general secretion pathway protein A